MGIISEESSSSYPDESGLELGLTLGGGGGGGGGRRSKLGFGCSSSLSSSSSSSSSANFSPVPPNTTAPSNQVVGWPPIRTYRMNSMVNQVKYPCGEEFQSNLEKCKSKDADIDMNFFKINKNHTANEEGQERKSKFVKVHMDGNGIGRKVEMSAHSCYKTLALTMEDMFFGPATTRKGTRSSKLLDGSSEFVLTYEDKDGDWMLVGDVPWGMFINSVKRLRVMRKSEANGLGCKFQVRTQETEYAHPK